MLRGRKPYADPQSPIFSFITSQKDMDCPDIVLRLEGIGPKLLFYVQAYKCKPGTYWRAHLLVFVVLAVACMHQNFNFMGQISSHPSATKYWDMNWITCSGPRSKADLKLSVVSCVAQAAKQSHMFGRLNWWTKRFCSLEAIVSDKKKWAVKLFKHVKMYFTNFMSLYIQIFKTSQLPKLVILIQF